MKLQLNNGQIVDFAEQAGVFTTVAEATETILGLFASAGHDPVTRKDVCAVIEAMGGWVHAGPGAIDLNKGDAWKAIGSALSGLGRAPGRGYYTQGNRVGIKTVSEKLVEMAEAGDVRIASKAGVRFAGNLSLSVDEDSIGYYANDPGLRRIAADQTKCFGFYSQRAGACRSCPLASFCAEAQMSKLGEIASRLDAETESNLKAALEPATEEVAVEEAVSETHLETMVLPFEGVCGHCQGVMPEGSEGVYVDGKGLLHVACVSEVDNG